jgi:hypothetical protein
MTKAQALNKAIAALQRAHESSSAPDVEAWVKVSKGWLDIMWGIQDFGEES